MTDIHHWSPSPPIRTTTPQKNENAIPEEVLNSLRRHSLFQRSNNQQFLERIACSMNIRTYSPHDVIVVEGAKAKAMFLLLRGSVNVCSADFERIYATLEPGTFFGEIGLLYAIPRTATVIAATPCTVAVLTAEAVSAILPDYPAVERILRFEAQERMAMLDKVGKRKSTSASPASSISNNGGGVELAPLPTTTMISDDIDSEGDLKKRSSVTGINSFVTASAYDLLTKVCLYLRILLCLNQKEK